eukprot:m.256411 g.256411  ORF g.256411 m.256411 type:complete len:452 (-) comp15520_c0_seq1:566-1921(-)
MNHTAPSSKHFREQTAATMVDVVGVLPNPWVHEALEYPRYATQHSEMGAEQAEQLQARVQVPQPGASDRTMKVDTTAPTNTPSTPLLDTIENDTQEATVATDEDNDRDYVPEAELTHDDVMASYVIHHDSDGEDTVPWWHLEGDEQYDEQFEEQSDEALFYEMEYMDDLSLRKGFRKNGSLRPRLPKESHKKKSHRRRTTALKAKKDAIKIDNIQQCPSRGQNNPAVVTIAMAAAERRAQQERTAQAAAGSPHYTGYAGHTGYNVTASSTTGYRRPAPTGQARWVDVRAYNGAVAEPVTEVQQISQTSYTQHREAEQRRRALAQPAQTLEELLAQLQYRDATPEDYMLLVQLDDSITHKTCNEESLKSMCSLNVVDEEWQAQHPDESCGICISEFDIRSQHTYCGHSRASPIAHQLQMPIRIFTTETKKAKSTSRPSHKYHCQHHEQHSTH